MSLLTRSFCALMLVLACLPALAAADCLQIQSLSANDVQTGQPVTITWSFTGGPPQSQTLTGPDFPAAIVLGPAQTSYTYTPSTPGEKHIQLAAVSDCGTVTQTGRYHVKQCNVVAPAVTVSSMSVSPGNVFQASVTLPPGQTVRWEVTNGTASSTTGASIQITAGGAGTVTIDAWVSRGNSCSVKSSATVQVVSACSIQQPTIYTPSVVTPNNYAYADVFNLAAGETVTFAVHGAEILFTDVASIFVLAPASGSFSIDIIVSNATCSRTFTRSFVVEACTASAVVHAGTMGECGATTAVAELTGVGPFYGVWSDGQDFSGYETRIERPISGGTYTLTFFADGHCQGAVTGSVQGGANLPQPVYTLDPIVNDGYYGNDTCPGLVRTATVNDPVPAGATVEWTVTNGTIVSGQGTPTVQFAGTSAGYTLLTSTLRDAQGCPSASYTNPYLLTKGEPAVTITVEPQTIGAGGTALITLRANQFARGMDISSSLGDTIAFLESDPFENGLSRWEYRSTNGGGVATISVFVENGCGVSKTVTATLNVDGGNPTQAVARVRAIGSSCPDYNAFAEFTGVAPFSGTWSNGETFSGYDQYAMLQPPTGGSYTLVAFSDANGAGTVIGEATFDFTRLPEPDFAFSTNSVCPNTIITATLTAPLPEGVTANWYMDGEILSGQGTDTIQVRTNASGGVQGGVMLTGPGSCSTWSQNNHFTWLVPQPISPSFGVYPIYAGNSLTFDVTLDPNTATWAFENSLGDAMEIVGNPQPNVYQLRYTSTHEGVSDIRVYGTNTCGTEFTTTHQLYILPPQPTVTLTSTPRATCGAIVTATFTGTAPFSGTWGDNGETFFTSEMSITRFVGAPIRAFLLNFHDANSPGDSGAIDVEMNQVPYVYSDLPEQICAGTTTTVSAYGVPEGGQVIWTMNGTAARIVSGQGTSTVIIEGVEEGYVFLQSALRTEEGCMGDPNGKPSTVAACPAP